MSFTNNNSKMSYPSGPSRLAGLLHIQWLPKCFDQKTHSYIHTHTQTIHTHTNTLTNAISLIPIIFISRSDRLRRNQ